MTDDLIETRSHTFTDGTAIQIHSYWGDITYDNRLDLMMLSNVFILRTFIIVFAYVPPDIYMAIVYMGIGVFNLLYWFKKHYSIHKYYKHWIKVPAKKLDMWIDEYRFRTDPGQKLCLRIKYEYAFRNITYMSLQTAYNHFNYCQDTMSGVKKLLDKFKDSTMFSWVDPQEPYNAVVFNHMNFYERLQYGLIIFCGLVFILVAVYFALESILV